LKKLFFLSFVIFILLSFIGCDDTTTSTIEPPRDLTLSAVSTDHTRLKLDWTASETADIDGYNVYLNGVKLNAAVITETEYTHTPTSLGDYEVVAVKGEDESDPATGSSKTQMGTSDTVWYRDDPLSTHPSGFGWDVNSGNGSTNSLSGSHDVVQMFLDSDLTFADPFTYLGTDWPRAYFLSYTRWSQPTVYTVWPVNATNWGDAFTSNVGDRFIVAIERGSDYYFVKIFGIIQNGNARVFEYSFQKIPNFLKVD
jgi:hypothetical protein